MQPKHTLQTSLKKTTPPPLPTNTPQPQPTFDGVKIDICPGTGQPSTHLTTNRTVVRYEPYWESDGSKKTIVHVRGVIEESYMSGLADKPQNPLVSGGMEALHDEYAYCDKCALKEHRVQVVFGSGNQVDPKILIVGEAPGPDENHHGRPFVGRTGQLLRKTLKEVGIDPDRDCYITNAVCCYPYNEQTGSFRPPTGSEIATCRPRLQAQTKIIKSSVKVVLCLGKRAFATFTRPKLLAQGLLETKAEWDKIKMNEEIGWYTGPGSDKIPVKIYSAYHPSFIARRKESTARALHVAWKLDLKAVADYALHGQLTDPRVIKP